MLCIEEQEDNFIILIAKSQKHTIIKIMIDDQMIECDAIELANKKKTRRRKGRLFRNGGGGGTPTRVGIRKDSESVISDISLGDFKDKEICVSRSRGSLHSETTMQKANGISRFRQHKQRLLDLIEETRDDDGGCDMCLEWESVNSSSIGEEEEEVPSSINDYDEENIHRNKRSDEEEEDNDSEEEDRSRDSVFSTEISSTSEGIEVNSNDSSVGSLEEVDAVTKEISKASEVHVLGHMKIAIDQVDDGGVSTIKDDSDFDDVSDASSSVGVESAIIDEPMDQERLKSNNTRNDDDDDASSYAVPWLAVTNKPTGNSLSDHQKQSKKNSKSSFDKGGDENGMKSCEGNQDKNILQVSDDDESFCPNLVEASSNSSDENSAVGSYSSTSSSSSIDLMMQALATASEKKKVAEHEANEMKPKRSESSSVCLLSVPSGCSHPFACDSLDLVADDEADNDDDDDDTSDFCCDKRKEGDDDDDDQHEDGRSVRYYIPTHNQSNSTEDDKISNQAIFFSSGALAQEPIEYSLNEYVTTRKEDSQMHEIQQTTSSSIKIGSRRRSEGGKFLLSIFPHRSSSSTSSKSSKSNRNRFGFTISRKRTEESGTDSELEDLRKYFKGTGLYLMEQPPSQEEPEIYNLIVRESSTTKKKQRIPEPEQETDLKGRSFLQTRSKTNRSNKTTRNQDDVEAGLDIQEYFREAGLEVTEIRT